MTAPSPSLKRFRTEGFAGYSLAFSPFFPNRLAIAGSANFGLVGNGRLSVLENPPGMPMRSTAVFDTQDGLYDLAWSELHENQIVTASGDGSVKLWDLGHRDFPIRKWMEHSKEVYSVDWNNIQKDLFATSSWDCTVKLWTPDRPSSIQTIPAHTACVYNVVFSPQSPTMLATCSTDGFLKTWDTRSQQPVASIQASQGEVLTCDWNKYFEWGICSGGVDRAARVWDLRMVHSQSGILGGGGMSGMSGMAGQGAVCTLLGHEYAVRKVSFSPHAADVVATASYDMTSRIWRVDGQVLGAATPAGPPPGFSTTRNGSGIMERVHMDHTEFVVGLAWSFEEDLVASCGWDQEVHLWR